VGVTHHLLTGLFSVVGECTPMVWFVLISLILHICKSTGEQWDSAQFVAELSRTGASFLEANEFRVTDVAVLPHSHSVVLPFFSSVEIG
jgi:hypothetical protein